MLLYSFPVFLQAYEYKQKPLSTEWFDNDLGNDPVKIVGGEVTYVTSPAPHQTAVNVRVDASTRSTASITSRSASTLDMPCTRRKPTANDE